MQVKQFYDLNVSLQRHAVNKEAITSKRTSFTEGLGGSDGRHFAYDPQTNTYTLDGKDGRDFDDFEITYDMRSEFGIRADRGYVPGRLTSRPDDITLMSARQNDELQRRPRLSAWDNYGRTRLSRWMWRHPRQ